VTRVVYLHGFASSPQSGKARFFRERFAELGVDLEIPQLDEGNFQALTITGQLGVIDRAMGGSPATLMGSSLGGYLAAVYAGRHPEVERLVLLAPAFHFPERWPERYTLEQRERWKRQGSMPVFHYGYGREMALGYGIVEDAESYENEPDFTQPALIIHGTRDDIVPAQVSISYASRHPNVDLHLMESGHELTDVLNPMWELIRAFIAM
jgi:pimeloyl-ACP methyl ester carboxylesterase